MRYIFITLLIFIVWTGPAVAQDRISFVTLNWEPYSGEHLLDYGVGSAIVAEACRRVGLQSDFYFMPWKRAMEAVKLGSYDALYSAYYSQDRANDYAVSDPYMTGQLVLCVKNGSNVKWDGTIRSLAPYKIGVVLGFVNTPEFDEADYLDKDVGPNDLLNLNKLLNGRVDAVVIDMYQAIYLIKNSPMLRGTLSEVHFLGPPLAIKNIHVMFSKARPKWRSHLERFNEGLSIIESDGTKDEIMHNFRFLPPRAP